MTMKKMVAGGLVAGMLAGCAQQPEQIGAAYVSPMTFADWSCDQIVYERNRVVRRVDEVAGKQKAKANSDAAATAVGMVLFWPALFMLGTGSDHSAELANLKGSYDALTAAGERRRCRLT